MRRNNGQRRAGHAMQEDARVKASTILDVNSGGSILRSDTNCAVRPAALDHLNHAQARLILLALIALKRRPCLSARNHLLQPAQELAAIAHAQTKRLLACKKASK